MDQPITSTPQPQSNNRNMIIIGVVVVLLLCCCCAVVSGVALWACGDMFTGIATTCSF